MDGIEQVWERTLLCTLSPIPSTVTGTVKAFNKVSWMTASCIYEWMSAANLISIPISQSSRVLVCISKNWFMICLFSDLHVSISMQYFKIRTHENKEVRELEKLWKRRESKAKAQDFRPTWCPPHRFGQ